MGEFERVESERNHPPKFTIYTNGSGRFNSAATDQYLDDDIDAVSVYIDEDDHRLGFAMGGAAGAYTLTHRDNSGAEIGLNGPLAQLGVAVADLDESWQFEIEHAPDEGLLIINISDLVAEVGE